MRFEVLNYSQIFRNFIQTSILLTVSILSLTGCANVSPQPFVSSNSMPDPGVGYVAGMFSGKVQSGFEFRLTETHSNKEYDVPFFEPHFFNVNKEALANRSEDIRLVAIPVGTYRLSSWLTYDPSSNMQSTIIKFQDIDKNTQFEVKPGTVYLLGRFAASEETYGYRGVRYKITPIQISDEEFTSLFKARYPNYTNSRIEFFNFHFPTANTGNATLDAGLSAYQRKDYSTAFKEFQSAAEKGDAAAEGLLASMYARGLGVQKNNAEAIKWWRKAADQGDAKSQFILGSLYKGGFDVPKDENESFKWYRKSADQGFVDSQNAIGVAYWYGLSVPKDQAEAVKWYRLAADQGYAESQYRLGYAYANGQGVTKDEKEAINWYHKAADQGFAPAKKSLEALKAR